MDKFKRSDAVDVCNALDAAQYSLMCATMHLGEGKGYNQAYSFIEKACAWIEEPKQQLKKLMAEQDQSSEIPREVYIEELHALLLNDPNSQIGKACQMQRELAEKHGPVIDEFANMIRAECPELSDYYTSVLDYIGAEHFEELKNNFITGFKWGMRLKMEGTD